MKKVFAGERINGPISLIESLLSRGILREEGETSLDEFVEYCAEHIAEDIYDEEPSRSSEDDDIRKIGDNWEYGGWTLEWEGKGSFYNYYMPATHDNPAESESVLTSCEISRAVAWEGEYDPSKEVDIKSQLQAALNPLLQSNLESVKRGH